MTNALAVLNGSNSLSPLEAAILAESAEEQNAFDYVPTRIKFPSGGMVAFSTNDDDVIKPPFNAIIAVSQKARAWWPGKDTAGLPPLCSSPDGVNGLFNDADETQIPAALQWPVRHPALSTLDKSAVSGPWSCSACPLAQWGSGQGKGQACKVLRRLVILVEGWNMPAIITLPPTSVKIFDAYASARARTKGNAYFTAWTRFDLEKKTNAAGIGYGVVKLTASQPLNEGEVAAVFEIRRQFAALVRTMNIDADDYATDSADSSADTVAADSASDIPF